MPRLLSAFLITLALAAPASALVPLPHPPAPPGFAYQWIPPISRTVVDRTWIPDRLQWQYDWVQTAPNRLEQIWHQVLIPGHWDSTTRQLPISPGYWQLVRIEPPPPPFPLPHPVFLNPPTVGVEGYATSSSSDLSKFSSLSEWPQQHP